MALTQSRRQLMKATFGGASNCKHQTHNYRHAKIGVTQCESRKDTSLNANCRRPHLKSPGAPPYAARQDDARHPWGPCRLQDVSSFQL